MATQVEFVKAFVKSIIDASKSGSTGTAALKPFLSSLGFSNYRAAKTAFFDDMSDYSISTSSTQFNNFLLQECGIDRSNDDIGAITGSDAGGSVAKTAESIIPENGELKEVPERNVNIKGLTVLVTGLYKQETIKEKLSQKLVSWWIPESLDLIDESLGINFYDGRAEKKSFKHSGQ